MWTRAELKANAKNTLQHTFWECVAACVIVILISGAASYCTVLLSFIPGINFLASWAIILFVSMPMTVGLYFFFMQARLAPPVLTNLFYAFDGRRFMKIVGAMAWWYLFLVLWSMIPLSGTIIVGVKFIISGLPVWMLEGFTFDSSWISVAILCGIIYIAGAILVMIKSIAYSMTPFILTDNPSIGYQRALKLSIAMTRGHKWQIFVLGLSFIGWMLLAILTLFIGFIFLMPYIYATYTELYVKLRNNAINNGITSPSELNVIIVQN